VVSIISRNGLYKQVTDSIRFINLRLESDKKKIAKSGTIELYHIATSMLIAVNTQLRNLASLDRNEEREELEYYLGNLFKRILIQVVSKIPAKFKMSYVESIYNALNETCSLNGYNFDQLMKILGVEMMALKNVAELGSDAIITPTIEASGQTPSFIWLSNSTDSLGSFIDLSVNLKITSDGDGLKKIFNAPFENLAIDLNNKKPEYVLQFLACVNASKLVSYSGCSGFYQVLQSHVKNFDSVFLKNKDPYRGVEKVKRLLDWEANKKQFNAALKTLR
jgi:hypothetical protein